MTMAFHSVPSRSVRRPRVRAARPGDGRSCMRGCWHAGGGDHHGHYAVMSVPVGLGDPRLLASPPAAGGAVDRPHTCWARCADGAGGRRESCRGRCRACCPHCCPADAGRLARGRLPGDAGGNSAVCAEWSYRSVFRLDDRRLLDRRVPGSVLLGQRPPCPAGRAAGCLGGCAAGGSGRPGVLVGHPADHADPSGEVPPARSRPYRRGGGLAVADHLRGGTAAVVSGPVPSGPRRRIRSASQRSPGHLVPGGPGYPGSGGTWGRGDPVRRPPAGRPVVAMAADAADRPGHSLLAARARRHAGHLLFRERLGPDPARHYQLLPPGGSPACRTGPVLNDLQVGSSRRHLHRVRGQHPSAGPVRMGPGGHQQDPAPATTASA
jgi:hypothetical protein